MFVLGLTAIVAVLLSFMSTFLKPIHDANEAVYNKTAILSAISDHLGSDLSTMSADDIDEIFESKVTQQVVNMKGEPIDEAMMMKMGFKNGSAEAIDMGKEMKKPEADRVLPVFVYKKDNGENYYILNVRGKGLWDEIWGCIAVEKDLNTIAGVAFDHKAETPGLGAEIKDSKAFQEQFVGKKIYNDDGMYKSIYVRKGGAKDPVHEVDGISGATITADGVTEMMERGIAYYEPYFKTIKK